MAASGSTKIVVIALAANVAIACAKFAAYVWTGSSAMLSETVHALARTSNQALLLYGQKRSQRPADARHPFGYARELYFWSFIVAILLFSLGAGVSLYEGVDKLIHPDPIKNVMISYVVLGVAFVFQAFAMAAAMREANRRHRDEAVFPASRGSKDPVLFTIIFQDAAALIGLTVAFVGTLLADVWGMAEADGIASIVIGLLLAYVAAFIAVEVKGLLVGESASPAERDGIRDIIVAEADGHGQINAINEIKTMQLGANAILVAASVDFKDETSAGDIMQMTQRIEDAIRAQFQDVTKFFVEVQSAEQHKQMRVMEHSDGGTGVAAQ